MAICIAGKTCPPATCFGCGSAGYGKRLRCRMASGVMPAKVVHSVPAASRAVGPTGSGLPRDIFASGSSRGVRS